MSSTRDRARQAASNVLKTTRCAMQLKLLLQVPHLGAVWRCLWRLRLQHSTRSEHGPLECRMWLRSRRGRARSSWRSSNADAFLRLPGAPVSRCLAGRVRLLRHVVEASETLPPADASSRLALRALEVA